MPVSRFDIAWLALSSVQTSWASKGYRLKSSLKMLGRGLMLKRRFNKPLLSLKYA